jgi:hypothetical protein
MDVSTEFCLDMIEIGSWIGFIAMTEAKLQLKM